MAQPINDQFLLRARRLCRSRRPLLVGLLGGILLAVAAIAISLA